MWRSLSVFTLFLESSSALLATLAGQGLGLLACLLTSGLAVFSAACWLARRFEGDHLPVQLIRASDDSRDKLRERANIR